MDTEGCFRYRFGFPGMCLTGVLGVGRGGWVEVTWEVRKQVGPGRGT